MSDNYATSTTNFKITINRVEFDDKVYWDNGMALTDTVTFAFDDFDFMFYSKSVSGFGGVEGWGLQLGAAPNPELFMAPDGYLQTSVGYDQTTAAPLDIGNIATSISLNKPTVVDSITAKTTNGNLQIGGDGSGLVELQGDLSNSAANLLLSQSFGTAGFGTSSIAASAQLEVSSTTRGFLTSRMSEPQRDAITSPADALLIWSQSTNQYNVFVADLDAWVILGPALNFQHNTTWSGIWASAQSGNIAYTKLDKRVTLHIPTLSAAATISLSISNDTVLPVSLRPATEFVASLFIVDDKASAGTLTLASAIIKTDGSIEIFSGPAIDTHFVGTSSNGNSGVRSTYITYLTA